MVPADIHQSGGDGAAPVKRQSERQDFFREIKGIYQDTEFYGTIQNLSAGGLCFETDFLFRTGQLLNLTLTPAAADGNSLNVQAEVVWVQPMHMLFHRIGAKFKNLTQNTQATVSQFVSKIEAVSKGVLPSVQPYRHLLDTYDLSGLSLKNRITMAPMFWGYAEEDGTVSQRLLDTYGNIAAGGASMVVVANAVVDPSGIMAPRTLRIDGKRFVPGLSKLARVIKDSGAVACLQLNHGGRWARVEKPCTPSPLSMGVSSDIEAFEGMRKEMSRRHQLRLVNKFLSSVMKCRRGMTKDTINQVTKAFATGAERAKEAGFDMVELHGATGYLLSQFLSPRSNRRTDEYGGAFENRIRFPLQVLEAVKGQLGDDFPVGYRFMADEWLPGGFQVKEAQGFAEALERSNIAYLSVTAGSYESFFLPEIMNRSRKEGYAQDLARDMKKAAPRTPVIVAGRIVDPTLGESIISSGSADLIGLARTLFADPQWPQKVQEGREDEILHCKCCNTCFMRVINDEPVVCSRWDTAKRADLRLALTDKRKKWRNVLIAVNDSEHSLEAVEYVGHMIGTGKKIKLFSIIDDMTQPDASELDRRALLSQAKTLLENAGIAENDITTKVARMKKSVEQDLLREIENGGYGSVILGKKGVSRTHEVLFGSISNYIVHHAKDCGVWVVD